MAVILYKLAAAHSFVTLANAPASFFSKGANWSWNTLFHKKKQYKLEGFFQEIRLEKCLPHPAWTSTYIQGGLGVVETNTL